MAIRSAGSALLPVTLAALAAGKHVISDKPLAINSDEGRQLRDAAVAAKVGHVVTFNYRGSWGSPGHYSFANDLEDADAVLAYLENPANASRLGIDTNIPFVPSMIFK